MKFPYKLIPLSEKSEIFGFSILRPIIPVKLFGKAIEFEYEVLIDSGADFCIFDGELGDALGLDVKTGHIEIFGGVQDTGSSTAYLHYIKISIGGKQMEVPALFSYGIAKNGYGILGQRGFFDRFVVRFDYLAREVEVKPKV